ncbi:MAG: YiiD C-terminal domain-containing protein [Pseudomonadota bacterium]
MNANDAQSEQEYFETYLHRELPISRFMEVSVAEVSEQQVLLRAPLPPNKNDKNTGFGGSLASLLFMAGWGWLFNALRRAELNADIVVQDSEIRYHRPSTGDLFACCEKPPAQDYDAFLDRLEQKRVARITLSSWIGQASEPNVRMTGRFVAKMEEASA